MYLPCTCTFAYNFLSKHENVHKWALTWNSWPKGISCWTKWSMHTYTCVCIYHLHEYNLQCIFDLMIAGKHKRYQNFGRRSAKYTFHPKRNVKPRRFFCCDIFEQNLLNMFYYLYALHFQYTYICMCMYKYKKQQRTKHKS